VRPVGVVRCWASVNRAEVVSLGPVLLSPARVRNRHTSEEIGDETNHDDGCGIGSDLHGRGLPAQVLQAEYFLRSAAVYPGGRLPEVRRPLQPYGVRQLALFSQAEKWR
jgi:hypothetical protein